jgi:hypothetical protein
MDINGAKALKRRLGLEGADEPAPVVEPANVPADAPPVYRWTGVGKAASEVPPDEPEEEPATSNVSFFRRLGFTFR